MLSYATKESDPPEAISDPHEMSYPYHQRVQIIQVIDPIPIVPLLVELPLVELLLVALEVLAEAAAVLVHLRGLSIPVAVAEAVGEVLVQTDLVHVFGLSMDRIHRRDSIELIGNHLRGVV